jgi:hypothetical protein
MLGVQVLWFAKTGCRHDYAMRRNDGRGFESHATAEKYNGHLISLDGNDWWNPSEPSG